MNKTFYKTVKVPARNKDLYLKFKITFTTDKIKNGLIKFKELIKLIFI